VNKQKYLFTEKTNGNLEKGHRGKLKIKNVKLKIGEERGKG